MEGTNPFPVPSLKMHRFYRLPKPLTLQSVTHVEKGDICLTALYVDKSNRLAATMRVYDYLSCDSPYVKDSAVTDFRNL